MPNHLVLFDADTMPTLIPMGLLRALFITAVVFFVTRIILERFVNYLPERVQPMLAPHIPLVVVFLIELLL